jgi:UDP-glucose 4-epimerase
VNIGNSIETSILDLAKTIIKLTNSESKIVYLPPLEEGDMTRRCPDNKEMLEVIDRSLILLEEGLKKIIAQGLFEINNI